MKTPDLVAFHPSQGVHAAQEGQEAPQGIPPVVGPRSGTWDKASRSVMPLVYPKRGIPVKSGACLAKPRLSGVYLPPDGQARLCSPGGKPQGGSGALPALGPGGGRLWRYDHALYLALLLYRAFFRLTYRKTEALLQDLMEGPFPSHQSLARYAVHHLDPKLLEALLERLSRELEAHLASSPSPEEEGQEPGRLQASSPGATPGALSPPLPHGHHGAGLPEQGPASPLPSGEGGAAGAGARAASGPDAVG